MPGWFGFFQTDQGIRNLNAAQADAKASSDPDYAIRDLYNAIANGNFVSPDQLGTNTHNTC